MKQKPYSQETNLPMRILSPAIDMKSAIANSSVLHDLEYLESEEHQQTLQELLRELGDLKDPQNIARIKDLLQQHNILKLKLLRQVREDLRGICCQYSIEEAILDLKEILNHYCKILLMKVIISLLKLRNFLWLKKFMKV